MAVPEVARVPHQAVDVGRRVERRDQVPGLAGEKVEGAHAQVEIGVADAQDLPRLAAPVLEVGFDDPAQAAVASQVDGLEFHPHPGESRMHPEMAVVLLSLRGVLGEHPVGKLMVRQPGVVENGVEADEAVEPGLAGDGRARAQEDKQQSERKPCGLHFFFSCDLTRDRGRTGAIREFPGALPEGGRGPTAAARRRERGRVGSIWRTPLTVKTDGGRETWAGSMAGEGRNELIALLRRWDRRLNCTGLKRAVPAGIRSSGKRGAGQQWNRMATIT